VSVAERIHYLITSPKTDEDVQLMRTLEMHIMHHTRPRMVDLLMDFTKNLAKRTNCGRAGVACVITNREMTRIEAMGYNGQGKGLPHSLCKAHIQSRCGCAHAEANAMAKIGVDDKEKVFFITVYPCQPCATLIINSGASKVYVGGAHYRPVSGRDFLERAGIEVVELE
jgi:deoxycytidylate deaminase